MGKRLFLASGVLAMLALAASMLGIWTDDVRWFDTCGAISVLFGGFLTSGIFTALAEMEL